ncbi:hypothetical protein [Siccirubricoccus phaeus]|uniref:hypothetical protein n=1 Tax=Siccirubricoccus phaeus TaxID=2595053 RepID=UPI0011F32CAA|nr:hypothetical protein [Siccirubricoccus phaeus]
MPPSPPPWLVRGQRPVLMAIGDSFLNGMRSLTIDGTLAGLSIPAEVGRCLVPPPGFAPFVPAAYPRALLIDAEAVLRTHVHSAVSSLGLIELGAALPTIRAEVVANARAWLADRQARAGPAEPRCFDNLAIAGARLPDVFGTTYGQLGARWDGVRAQIAAGDDPFAWGGTLADDDPYGDDRAYADQPGPSPAEALTDRSWGVADCHITLNALHLLNPDSAPGLDGFRVIDIVHARRPHVLLVDVGPNHGLPDICMGGAGPRGAARLRRFARLWPRCAEELAATPELGLAVVLLPPLPSQVPALMPLRREDGSDPPVPPPGPDGRRYHPHYVSALSLGLGDPAIYTATEVQEFDAAAMAAREALRGETQRAFDAAGKRVVFIDLAALIGAHDVKNGMGEAFVPDQVTGIAYDNRSIADLGLPHIFHKLRGGICSLDNFHPTTLGYRYVARAVVEAIRQVEPALVGRSPRVSIAGDALLTDPPWPALSMLQSFWPLPPELPGGLVAAAAGLPAEREGRRAFGGLLRLGGMR